ncbi:MAG: UDP-glucuronic acid dehydrogenase [Alteromonadaceae bacterium]|nr:UDP-glucuronic acid dehydrogenase [Alteromonadaceae bacterium]
MNITVLCSDATHPVNTYLEDWVTEVSIQHNVRLVRSRSELTSGDFLFLVSCSELVKPEHRRNYSHTLVLHASDLPQGRGWSPHVWEIIQGNEAITLSLLEAEDKVDTGRVWLKRRIPIERTLLWYEVNNLLFNAEIQLMSEAIERYEYIESYPQDLGIEPTYYRKRTPKDSQIDPNRSMAEQFDLMRMCDPDRYPAWFELHGQKYKVILEKQDDE